MLNRRDTPRRKTLSIAQPINEVHNRRIEIARQNEIPVRRMCFATLCNSAPCCYQRLRKHLTAVHTLGTKIAVPATVDVDFEWLEIEQAQQIVDWSVHCLLLNLNIREKSS